MTDNIMLQVGVKALLKNADGKYLLIRRSMTKYPEVKNGRWDIVGGRINPGQTLRDNLAREIKEETELAIVGEPRLVATQDILKVPGRHVVRLTYIADTEGDVVLDTEENDEYRWLTFDNVLRQDDVDTFFRELLNQNIIIP